ncbi:g6f-like [Cololabis saira]|uniref:g6f-like n=1 Tax=Cololabis saira TaxID=129043 RepID=UPI002AD55016|nr:g6f-like [Cololabis saira]
MSAITARKRLTVTVVYQPHWDDLMVVEENKHTILGCHDTTVRGDISINWMVKSIGADEWKLVLSASEKNTFSGGSSKLSMRLIDSNFEDTGVFSLSFLPTKEDGGLYMCLVKKNAKKIKEKIILLAVLTVYIYPSSPVPQHSTLRLIARVSPDMAATNITWTAPGDIPIRSEKMPNTGTVAKLPQVNNADGGIFVCTVYPLSNSAKVWTADVNVAVAADKVASFTNITHRPRIFTAIQAQASFLLTCPSVQGDYVFLYWLPPNASNRVKMKLVFQYDRWRGSTLQTEQSKKFQLAGPPYNAEAGSFSFLLNPELKDGGLYVCEVFQNDNAFSQWTTLSVLKVKTSHRSSSLELMCLYSELSQVQSVDWKHHNKSRRLQLSSSSPGRVTTTLPLPITPDVAGNYTCTLKLKNGQVIRIKQTITVPTKERVTSSMPPSLFALLLLVPLVAAAVGVLLWRQKHISDRGIEQSLSVHSGEAENIYENPEDIRQAPPQGSVYMDLKPRGEDDVYKELERYEQCQG